MKAQPDAATIRQILAAPLGPDTRWGTPDSTVRDYLTELLAQIVLGEADAKYGLGDDDWQYELYAPLRDLGLIPPWEDGWGVGHRLDGSGHPEDQKLADTLLAAAARALVVPPA